jgi:predicted nucleic acid-binding protein
MRALFDTNILIDYLIGHNDARLVIEQYENPQISIIRPKWWERVIPAMSTTKPLLQKGLNF